MLGRMPVGPEAAPSVGPGHSADPRLALGQAVGMAAFLFGYPLVECLRTCRLQTLAGPGDGVAWRADIDRLQHVQRAATAADRDVVTPANDLLYTTGWIHLADGPRLLQVPSAARHPGRYFVLALYDAWTHNFENLGPRNCAADGQTVVLVGPGVDAAAIPPGLRVVRSPTPLVWLIARMVVGDAADVAAAIAVQGEIELRCLPGTDHGRLPAAVSDWRGPPQDTMAALAERPGEAAAIAADFFNNLCHGLADAPAPLADQGMLSWLASAGLVAGAAFDFKRLDAATQAGLCQGLQDGAALVETRSRSRAAKAWAAHFGLGRYGQQYLLRALTAYKGLGALAADEAVYAMGDFDADKQPLDGHGGRSHYVLRFEPQDMPPVDAFWSVTLYDADRFLYANAAQRFSLGDRSPGLQRDADGGLSLHIAHTAPADAARHGNWLPAPRGGFYLILRLYWPRDDARAWRIPPLTRIH